ncbi:MAG: transposase [candidate division KSB1 bacterium]|nr:transposase [candidate division KSB1 bacterium]
MRKAIAEVFGDDALVQRCQWHKRENVVAYLPKSLQARMRQKLHQAYEQPTYAQAKQALLRLHTELVQLNPSDAVNRRLPVSMKALKRRSRCIAWDFSKNWGSV